MEVPPHAGTLAIQGLFDDSYFPVVNSPAATLSENESITSRARSQSPLTLETLRNTAFNAAGNWYTMPFSEADARAAVGTSDTVVVHHNIVAHSPGLPEVPRFAQPQLVNFIGERNGVPETMHLEDIIERSRYLAANESRAETSNDATSQASLANSATSLDAAPGTPQYAQSNGSPEPFLPFDEEMYAAYDFHMGDSLAFLDAPMDPFSAAANIDMPGFSHQYEVVDNVVRDVWVVDSDEETD